MHVRKLISFSGRTKKQQYTTTEFQATVVMYSQVGMQINFIEESARVIAAADLFAPVTFLSG